MFCDLRYYYLFIVPENVFDNGQLDHILGRYGCFVVERVGSDTRQAISTLSKWRNNIYFVSQMIQNDVSSTKVRFFLRKGLSVRYLLPVGVIEYIEKNGIYVDEGRDAWNGNIIASQSAE